jgi:carboxymethylenebutenolidase
MPVYESTYVEYAIISGHVTIMLDQGVRMPAFWSHPDLGGTFPAIALIHDWWGIRPVERRLAQSLAQMGYYVIVPDLFGGETARTAQEAMKLVEALGDRGFAAVDAALRAMEHHARSNRSVAAVGLGMGGSLAYEAALTRQDLEAAVSFYGFPQRFLGRFKEAHAPILAVYGSHDPYTRPAVIHRLEQELAESSLEHEVHIIEGAERDFFTNGGQIATQAWSLLAPFLEKTIGIHSRPSAKAELKR